MAKNEDKPVVLFASDTQESSSYLKRSVTKIAELEGEKSEKDGKPWTILAASAGDALVIDEVVDDLWSFLRKQIHPDVENPSGHLLLMRKEIGDIAYSTFKKYRDRNIKGNFELLLGAADEFSTILYVTNEGKTQELEKYGIIGSGRITGGELLMSELLSERKETMTQQEAANLAALIVTTVGHIDLSVGGAPDIKICRDRVVWVYKEQSFNEMLKSSELKWNLLKRIWWRTQEDEAIVYKIKKMLSNYSEKKLRSKS